MGRVVGIGGIFFKAKDPTALRDWYRRHLGMDIQEWGGMAFDWNRVDGPGAKGVTAWSIFAESSSNFAPSAQRFMVNYIVDDLDALLDSLRNDGCNVDSKTDGSEYGKFGWVMDPEGNRLELWEPPAAGG